MSTDLKVETLTYALARARGFVTGYITHPDPNMTEDFQEFARGILTDIDRALEGTDYAPAREEGAE